MAAALEASRASEREAAIDSIELHAELTAQRNASGAGEEERAWLVSQLQKFEGDLAAADATTAALTSQLQEARLNATRARRAAKRAVRRGRAMPNRTRAVRRGRAMPNRTRRVRPTAGTGAAESLAVVGRTGTGTGAGSGARRGQRRRVARARWQGPRQGVSRRRKATGRGVDANAAVALAAAAWTGQERAQAALARMMAERDGMLVELERARAEVRAAAHAEVTKAAPKPTAQPSAVTLGKRRRGRPKRLRPEQRSQMASTHRQGIRERHGPLRHSLVDVDGVAASVVSASALRLRRFGGRPHRLPFRRSHLRPVLIKATSSWTLASAARGTAAMAETGGDAGAEDLIPERALSTMDLAHGRIAMVALLGYCSEAGIKPKDLASALKRPGAS